MGSDSDPGYRGLWRERRGDECGFRGEDGMERGWSSRLRTEGEGVGLGW